MDLFDYFDKGVCSSNEPLEIIKQPCLGICRLKKKQQMPKCCLIISNLSLHVDHETIR